MPDAGRARRLKLSKGTFFHPGCYSCLQPDRTGDNVTVRPETLNRELPGATTESV